MVRNLLFILIIASLGFACSNSTSHYKTVIPSPNARVHIYFELNNGEPYYLVYYKNEILINWSALGLITDSDSLTHGLYLKETKTEVSSWPINQEPGAMFDMDEQYNDMLLVFAKDSNPDIEIKIQLRAYNNGFAFRYIIFPENFEKNTKLLEDASSFRINQSEALQNDTLPNPAILNFGNGIECEIYSQELKSFPEVIYIQDAKDSLKYNIGFKDITSTYLLFDFPYGPWRCFKFSIIEE